MQKSQAARTDAEPEASTTSRSRPESPTAEALEATLFPKPPSKAKPELETTEPGEMSSAEISESLYLTPEQEAASQAAGVTPALVPIPPPPRE